MVLTLAAAAACAAGDEEENAQASDAPAETAAALVATVTGLAGPEAVKFDPDQDVWLVSNFGPAAEDQRDGNGFIARVSADGAVETLRFMQGTEDRPLHMPRGMALQADTLWVADVDGIHGFHRATGRQMVFVDFRSFEPGFLNDIAIDPSGVVHVTDTGRGRVYRVQGHTPEIAVEDERTGPPNGITWDEERGAFLLAPWGGPQMLRAWSPEGGFTDVVTIPGGDLDGVEVAAGRILVASQVDSTLWIVRGAEPAPLARLEGAPADIGVDVGRGRVAIPYISRNLVEIWRVPELAGSEP